MADFIGAIRLPNTTFKRNRKHGGGHRYCLFAKESRGAGANGADAKFVLSGEIALPGESGSEKVHVNQYFIDNPQFVLGRAELAGTMYRANEYTVTSEYEDLYSEIDKVIQMLPENIMSVMVEKRTRELEEREVPHRVQTGRGYSTAAM